MNEYSRKSRKISNPLQKLHGAERVFIQPLYDKLQALQVFFLLPKFNIHQFRKKSKKEEDVRKATMQVTGGLVGGFSANSTEIDHECAMKSNNAVINGFRSKV